jgi:hypothetical protein
MQRQPTQLTPYLFVGGPPSSKWLRRYDIQYVVNVASEIAYTLDAGVRFAHIGMDDEGDDVRRIAPQCLALIDHVRANGGRVLVHCAAGRNRSVCICAAHLMSLGASLQGALEYIASKRTIAPHIDYVQQLAAAATMDEDAHEEDTYTDVADEKVADEDAYEKVADEVAHEDAYDEVACYIE